MDKFALSYGSEKDLKGWNFIKHTRPPPHTRMQGVMSTHFNLIGLFASTLMNEPIVKFNREEELREHTIKTFRYFSPEESRRNRI